MRRRLAALAVAAGALALPACSTGDAVVPPNGTLTMQVNDLTLKPQFSDTPANQIVVWSITDARAEVSGIGTLSFIGTSPCELRQNALLGTTLTGSCGGSGVSLEPDVPRTATVVLKIASMEVVRARRPELTAGGDVDGDTVLDLEDNCPYAANPGQENQNAAAEAEEPVGDACSIDPALTLRDDEDGDNFSDGSDNCVYVANPLQENTVTQQDGVGDACEQRAPVTLPSDGLEFTWPDQAFTVPNGGVRAFLVDFKSATSVTCDAAFSSCALDTAGVTLTVTP
jgi:hypothetical protein